LELAAANGGELPVMEMKTEHGHRDSVEVEAATAAEFEAVGMGAAAQSVMPQTTMEDVAPEMQSDGPAMGSP
jgi:hypothetical protein